MLPIAAVLLKLGAAGAGWSLLSRCFDKPDKEEKRVDKSIVNCAEEAVASAAAAAAAGALLLFSMQAFLHGMMLVSASLEDQGLP